MTCHGTLCDISMQYCMVIVLSACLDFSISASNAVRERIFTMSAFFDRPEPELGLHGTSKLQKCNCLQIIASLNL